MHLDERNSYLKWLQQGKRNVRSIIARPLPNPPFFTLFSIHNTYNFHPSSGKSRWVSLRIRNGRADTVWVLRDRISFLVRYFSTRQSTERKKLIISWGNKIFADVFFSFFSTWISSQCVWEAKRSGSRVERIDGRKMYTQLQFVCKFPYCAGHCWKCNRRQCVGKVDESIDSTLSRF